MKTIKEILDNELKNFDWVKSFIYGHIPETELTRIPEVLAVDGDIIAYRTAAVCEDHFEGACKSIIDTTLRDISTSSGVPLMRIYLSGRDNFRYEIGKTKPYKGNRATMVAPKYLNFCKEYLETQYKGVRVHGYEADDGIATDMTVNGAHHCGIDKDMLQIAGKHYNYVNKVWREVDEEEAAIILHRQILMGDTSDNVPGLPKVGEKTAEKAIQSAYTAYEDCLEMYKEVCADKLPGIDAIEYMKEQAALITMVSSVDLKFDNTIYVAPNSAGFAVQEGEDIVEAKAAPRL